MSSIRSPLGWDWDAVVERLDDHVDLEASSRVCGAIQRTRVIKTAAQLLRLVLAYVLGGLSFRGTAAWAEAVGEASMSDVALLKRVRRCGPWLREMVRTLAALHGPAAAACDTQRVVSVDATMICSPGDTRNYAVLHTVYDVTAQCFLATELTDRHTAERLDLGVIRPGEIRLGDRAYARWDSLQPVVAGGADFLVRLAAKAGLTLRTPSGSPAAPSGSPAAPLGGPVSRAGLCRQAEASGVQDVDLVIHAEHRGPGDTMPGRLIVLPLPPDKAEAARRLMRKNARKWGYQPSDDALATAGCLMLVTSLPRDAWPAQRLLDLYRRRWQVELAFKRLKSLIGLEALRLHDSELVGVWVHAVLLVALLIDHERPSPDRGEPDTPHWAPDIAPPSPFGGSTASCAPFSPSPYSHLASRHASSQQPTNDWQSQVENEHHTPS